MRSQKPNDHCIYIFHLYTQLGPWGTKVTIEGQQSHHSSSVILISIFIFIIKAISRLKQPSVECWNNHLLQIPHNHPPFLKPSSPATANLVNHPLDKRIILVSGNSGGLNFVGSLEMKIEDGKEFDLGFVH